MSISSWLVLGAVLFLALAVVARALAMFQGKAHWDRLAIGNRVVAAVALVAALVVPTLAGGDWSPFGWGYQSLWLGLSILFTHLVLTWRLGVDGASPLADLVAILVLLIGGWVSGGDAPAMTCVQQAPSFYAQRTLLLFGVGAALVSGSAGLLSVLRSLLDRGDWAGRLPLAPDLDAFLRHGTALSLVALGSGLALGVWWAWGAMGSLYGGEPREIWMASAWLVGAASLLSWQMGRRSGLWAAGLSMAAVIVGLAGLLI